MYNVHTASAAAAVRRRRCLGLGLGVSGSCIDCKRICAVFLEMLEALMEECEMRECLSYFLLFLLLSVFFILKMPKSLLIRNQSANSA